MIHVIATIQLAAGQRETFLAKFRELVPKVRAEQGCIEYGPAVDLPTPIAAQAMARDDVVTVIEKWADVPSLEAHLAAPHVLEYREAVKEMVVGLDLRVLEPA